MFYLFIYTNIGDSHHRVEYAQLKVANLDIDVCVHSQFGFCMLPVLWFIIDLYLNSCRKQMIPYVNFLLMLIVIMYIIEINSQENKL